MLVQQARVFLCLVCIQEVFSDKDKYSGILDLIEPGDSVMADKGFDISYELFIRGCKLNIPPFVRGGRLSKTV